MSGHTATSIKNPVATAPTETPSAPVVHAFDALPDDGWLRESQLVRKSNGKGGETAPLPFSPPTLWRKVKAGTFPKPVKLSERVTAWRVGDVRKWMREQTEATA